MDTFPFFKEVEYASLATLGVHLTERLGLPPIPTKMLQQNFNPRIEKIEAQKKPTISDRLAPLTDERCSNNKMIEYVTIKKLKG